MMRSIFKSTVAAVAFSIPVAVSADVAAKVDSWFNDMNYHTVTAPGVYEGQSARYATLGGISTRAPITQPFNFVSVQTPKFSAGCGGIDLYAGGFSAIDADQFIENLRAIGQNAQSLAFMLAIQIVSPQLSGVMEDIQTWADSYLNKNISSCEAASQLVGGALKYFDEEKANCITNRQQSYGEDFSTASFACTTGGSRKTTTGAGGDKNLTDFVKGNLAWYVLMQDPYFQADVAFSEVVVNLTGTLLIQDAPGGSDSPVIINRVLPAIVEDNAKERFDNIYAALLHGKKSPEPLKIYRCSGGAAANIDGCNSMTNTLQTITPNWTGLYDRVAELLNSIVEKIKNDTPLDAQEKGLIASTSVPIYRFLSAASTHYPNNTDVVQMSREYVNLISHDILLRSLNAVIQRVEQMSAMLKDGKSDSATVKEYRQDLNVVMQGFARLRKENDYKVEQLIAMQDRIAAYERALMPRIGAELVSAAMWGK